MIHAEWLGTAVGDAWRSQNASFTMVINNGKITVCCQGWQKGVQVHGCSDYSDGLTSQRFQMWPNRDCQTNVMRRLKIETKLQPDVLFLACMRSHETPIFTPCHCVLGFIVPATLPTWWALRQFGDSAIFICTNVWHSIYNLALPVLSAW